MTPTIGIDIHTLGLRQTGNETYIRNLVAEFCLMRLPWPLALYHTLPAAKLGGEQLCGSLRRLRPHSPLLRIPVSFPLALARDRVRLAHFQYVAPPLCPCPTVVTVHDISFEFFPEYFHPLQRARMRLLIPLSARRAAQVITISEYSRRTLIERYGLAEDRVTVTPLGVSPSFRVIEKDLAARATARFGIDGPFILGVGNLQPRKNLERLLRSFAALRRDTSCTHELVLVGQMAWLGHRVQEETRRLGIEAHVHQTGYVSEDELVALYNRADVFAYPSIFEGFGLPVIEAMACGTPVLTSNTSSLPEVAGDAALVVDPHDVEAIAEGLRRLVSERRLREKLTSAGFLQARQFPWRRTAEETVSVYARALAERR